MINIVAEAEALLPELDPALSTSYVVLLDETTPKHLHPAANCGGWTSCWADLIAPLLEAAGRWRGRGFCCFLRPPTAAMPLREGLGMAVHEAAHWLLYSESSVTFDWDTLDADVQRVLAPRATLAGMEQRVEADGPLCNYSEQVHRDFHEDDWLRACLHLTHRSNGQASIFSSAAMSCYGRADGWYYSMMLEDEYVGTRDVPLRELLQTEPAAAFSRLWKEDEPTD